MAKTAAPKLIVIKIKDIDRSNRAREDLGDLSGLAESIKEKGIIQPISITPQKKLLAGGRRCAAAELAGLDEIPAVIRESEDAADSKEIELFENVFRKDFAWDERIKLIQQIDLLYKAKKQDWSLRKTAQLLGASPANVSRQLQLAKALEIMPEMAKEVKTEAEAFKVLKKMEEQHATQILAARQQAAIKDGGKNFLKIADGNYQIGDTFKGLAGLKDNTFWCTFIECDPPYGIDLNEVKKGADAASTAKEYKEVPKDKYVAFLNKLSKELFRVANKNCWMIFWFGPTWFTEVKAALVGAGWEVDDIPAIWNKGQGQTMQPNIYFGRAYEPFFIARKGQPVLIKQGRANVFSYPGVPANQKYHPAQRPLDMMQDILRCFNPVRSTILVPFAGSGVTLRAAYLEGMNGLAWDLSDEYKPKFMLAVEEDMKKLDGDDKDD